MLRDDRGGRLSARLPPRKAEVPVGRGKRDQRGPILSVTMLSESLMRRGNNLRPRSSAAPRRSLEGPFGFGER